MKIDELKTLLPEDLAANLSDDSFDALQEAIETKINLSVDAALIKQDGDHADQLKDLMEALDKDRTLKLKKAISKVDHDRKEKLLQVVEKYNSSVHQDATAFKDDLVEKISLYLEEYIDEILPVETVAEAAKNNSARMVLNNLRNSLSIDSVALNESVKSAMLDGKHQIDDLAAKIKELEVQNQTLVEEKEKAESFKTLETLLEQVKNKRKCAYMRKVFTNRDKKFIEENFEYTSRLFDKQEGKEFERIRTDAFKKRKAHGDKREIETLIESQDKEEQRPAPRNPYVEELSKF